MKSRLIAKPTLQTMLKEARTNGLTVTKEGSGYTVKDGDTLVLKAMNGANAYLTRLNPDYYNG